MDAESALADLIEVSSQVEAAVLLEGGAPLATTVRDTARGDSLASASSELLLAAEELETRAAGALEQVEVATARGSVFVVREGRRAVAATTAPSPTVALVFYDLKTCLRAVADDAGGQTS